VPGIEPGLPEDPTSESGVMNHYTTQPGVSNSPARIGFIDLSCTKEKIKLSEAGLVAGIPECSIRLHRVRDRDSSTVKCHSVSSGMIR
jgi:hypothetical protein